MHPFEFPSHPTRHVSQRDSCRTQHNRRHNLKIVTRREKLSVYRTCVCNHAACKSKFTARDLLNVDKLVREDEQHRFYLLGCIHHTQRLTDASAKHSRRRSRLWLDSQLHTPIRALTRCHAGEQRELREAASPDRRRHSVKLRKAGLFSTRGMYQRGAAAAARHRHQQQRS